MQTNQSIDRLVPSSTMTAVQIRLHASHSDVSTVSHCIIRVIWLLTSVQQQTAEYTACNRRVRSTHFDRFASTSNRLSRLSTLSNVYADVHHASVFADAIDFRHQLELWIGVRRQEADWRRLTACWNPGPMIGTCMCPITAHFLYAAGTTNVNGLVTALNLRTVVNNYIVWKQIK